MPPEVEGPLLRALRDEDEEMRRDAADMLCFGHPTPAAVPALTAALSDGCARVRWFAASALEKLGRAAAEAEEALLRLLRDEQASVRCAAATALARLGARAPAAETLLAVLRNATEPDEAIDSLSRLADDAFLKSDQTRALREALDSPHANAKVRCHALYLFKASLRDTLPEALAGLRRAVADPDERMRRVALSMLRNSDLAAPQIAACLGPLLGDPSESVRLDALRTLLPCGDAVRIAVPQLREATNDPVLRFAASLALWRMGELTDAPDSGTWEAEIVRALREGKKISAIHRVRQEAGLGLVEAKNIVDAIQRKYCL
jgi:HEAT repeat protein